mmetsp:Transcript_11411/g.23875  ORF Transcript_11411/g.23875 Transcript_11411/m.23875 type:complete len:216 (-) Transcript_11411:110-757(-)
MCRTKEPESRPRGPPSLGSGASIWRWRGPLSCVEVPVVASGSSGLRPPPPAAAEWYIRAEATPCAPQAICHTSTVRVGAARRPVGVVRADIGHRRVVVSREGVAARAELPCLDRHATRARLACIAVLDIDRCGGYQRGRIRGPCSPDLGETARLAVERDGIGVAVCVLSERRFEIVIVDHVAHVGVEEGGSSATLQAVVHDIDLGEVLFRSPHRA